MCDRIFQRLTAFLSVFLLLAVGSSHLLCTPHVAHADEWQNDAPVHEHELCECGLCTCPARETNIAVSGKPTDYQITTPVPVLAVRKEAAFYRRTTESERPFAHPEKTLSAHLPFQRVTVILI